MISPKPITNDKRCNSIYPSSSDTEMTLQCVLCSGHEGEHEFPIYNDMGELHETVKWIHGSLK